MLKPPVIKNMSDSKDSGKTRELQHSSHQNFSIILAEISGY